MTRILVADDSLSSRMKISSMLSGHGFTILQAKSGEEAIEVIEKQKPDFVLLDLLMPKMTGQEVLKHLKDNNIDVPTAVLSADIQYSTKEECLKLGVVNFFNKPIMDIQTIIDTIKDYAEEE